MLFQSGLVYSTVSVKAGAKWGAAHPFFPLNTQHNQAGSRCGRNLGSAHLEQCDFSSSLIARGDFFTGWNCEVLLWLPWLQLKWNFLRPVPFGTSPDPPPMLSPQPEDEGKAAALHRSWLKYWLHLSGCIILWCSKLPCESLFWDFAVYNEPLVLCFQALIYMIV